MLKISSINNNFFPVIGKKSTDRCSVDKAVPTTASVPMRDINSENLKAYLPSFTAIKKKSNVSKNNQLPSISEQYKTVKSKLDKNTLSKLSKLDSKGILMDNSSNDGSTVLENLYKIAVNERIQGLDSTQILTEVINALDNPFTITQKFGDIPQGVADEISAETGKEFPKQAYNVISSSCVVASMEYNLASKKPAEFVRFAEGLSGSSYSVDKHIKISDVSNGIAECLWKLREFNTDSYIEDNWENINIKIKPDRNAIVRARVQSSYKDLGERSCVDVLIQSALLNLGSQNSYDALTDERTGKFNPDKSGLTNMEKNFVEQIVLESPKISVEYQIIDENGHLAGYNCEPHEPKQHILKSLELGQNVIIGYTHLDKDNNVEGGHEITIIGYKEDENKKGYFICNDTDDGIDEPIIISEEKLLPLIHHAGISKEALSKDDIITEPWRDILSSYKQLIASSSVNQQ